MSARDEIASELWLVMPSADDDEAREAAASLLDAYAAEVRAATLREAADHIAPESPDEHDWDDAEWFGHWSAVMLRDRADRMEQQ